MKKLLRMHLFGFRQKKCKTPSVVPVCTNPCHEAVLEKNSCGCKVYMCKPKKPISKKPTSGARCKKECGKCHHCQWVRIPPSYSSSGISTSLIPSCTKSIKLNIPFQWGGGQAGLCYRGTPGTQNSVFSYVHATL